MANEMHNIPLKSWILKYAAKHHMTSVIHQVLKDIIKAPEVPSSQGSLDTDLSFLEFNHQALPQLQPIYPVLALLWCTMSKMRNPSNHENVPLLRTAIELFEQTYSCCQIVPVELFLVLITRLKLMVLMQSVRQGDPDTGPLVNAYFPCWTQTVENLFVSRYHIRKIKQIEAVHKTYRKCRMLILNWMINQEHIESYYKHFKKNELENFIVLLQQNFCTFWERTWCILPTTEIEQILGGKIQGFADTVESLVLQYLFDSLKRLNTDDSQNVEQVLLHVLHLLSDKQNVTDDSASLNLLPATEQLFDSGTQNQPEKISQTQSENKQVLPVPCLEKYLPDVALKPCLVMFSRKQRKKYGEKYYDLYI